MRALLERWLGGAPGLPLFARAFAGLLLAALLPLAVVGLMLQTGLREQREQALAQARAQASRALADSLFERLLAARELMQAQAREAEARGQARVAPSGVFVAFDRVSPAEASDGAPQAVPGVAPSSGSGAASSFGDAHVAPSELARWWDEARRREPALAAPLPGPARLLTRPSAERTRAQVLLAWSSGEAVWLAQLDPLYLWPGLADARAALACVVSTAAQPVNCPAAAGRSEAHVPADGVPLTLREAFGADDWVVYREAPLTASAAAGGEGAVGATGLLTAALAIGLALVLAGGIAWRQARRGAQPMTELFEGTRRLARDDYAARVASSPGAEWTLLVGGFNTLARRLEGRYAALRGLEAIDRDVIEGVGPKAAMPRVLAQLAALWPGASAAVVLREVTDGLAVLRLHRLRFDAGAPELDCALPPVEGLGLPSQGTPATGRTGAVAPPLVVAAAAPDTIAWCWWTSVRQRGREVALLVAWSSGPIEPTAEAADHAHELRDHIGLMLAAQDRDRRLLLRARHDALTGLLNPSGFDEALEAMGRRRPQRFALLAIELPRADALLEGQGAGPHDELLAAAAQRLRGLLPPGAIACRADGAARFHVALPRGEGPPVEPALQRLAEALGGAFEVNGDALLPGAAIGFALCPEDGAARPELQARAVLALRAARDGAAAAGQAVAVRRFEAGFEAAELEAAGLRAELPRALDSGAFELHYQPRVDALSGRAVSAEALLRWRHPRRGLLAAADFMSVAAASGFAVPMGQWVLDAACLQLAAWRKAGLALARVNVNLSLRQLQEPDLDQTVLATLAACDLTPHDLEIEVGERVLAGADAGLRMRLARLRAAGVRIALDDFGTGLASMSSLRELPLDVMKIDASLVQAYDRETSARAVTHAVASLARSLGLALVAEGVETEADAERLRELPCDELQGYAFSAPVDAVAFARLPCVAWGGGAASGAEALAPEVAAPTSASG